VFGSRERDSQPIESRKRFAAYSRRLLGIAVVAVLLSGCAGQPGGRAGETWNQPAQIVDGYDCLAPNLGGWLVEPMFPGEPTPAEPSQSARPEAPPAGRVPAGFEPVVAIRCDLMAAIEDADGRWSGATAETLAGDLGPLLAALNQPDDGRWSGPCTADMELVPPLWLVDAAGRAIHVHYPVTGCGKTKPATREALAGLTTVETTTFKRRLTQSRAAIDAGCDAAWGSPSTTFGALAVPQVMTLPVPHELPTAVPGEPVPMIPGASASPGAVGRGSPPAVTNPGEVDGMRWCRYATPPVVPVPGGPDTGQPSLEGAITLQTGRFVAGGKLGQADARRVLATPDTGAGNDAAGTDAGSCELTSVAFVVLTPLRNGDVVGPVLTAELDGCGLLFSDGRDPRPISDGLRELLAVLTAV
jgi:hypothetical protein